VSKIDRLLFIYCKDGKAAVLNADKAVHDSIILGNNWKHTATIDPELWIEALLNEGRAEEMIDDLKGEHQTEQSATSGDLSAIPTRNSFAMNDAQINLAIAEAIGADPHWKVAKDYVNNLNAMHEAEEHLNGIEFHKYAMMLDDYEGSLFGMRATASQRAEAFLRTIGKWKEVQP
jgi:hypothetical protein